jgi:error-prone DNA polymerase
MKVDVLALGMLSCMRRAFEFMAHDKGVTLDLATIPAEDPATYAMIRRADTLGVFQIESRAQMASIPLMAPRTFYDLVIQVAIVRPGPIQGHPGGDTECPRTCIDRCDDAATMVWNRGNEWL